MLDQAAEPLDPVALRVNLALLDWNASRLAKEAACSRRTVATALRHPERLGLVAKYKLIVAVKRGLVRLETPREDHA